MNVEEIPLPPEARAGEIEGAYEVQLDNATSMILRNLKEDYGKVSEKIRYLPGETEPAKIFEFFEPTLSAKDFKRDATVPVSSRNYQLAVWRNDGWLGGQAVAVAVIDAGTDAEGKAIKFLAVFLGEK